MTLRTVCVTVGAVAASLCGAAMQVSASTSIDQIGSDIDGEASGDLSGHSVSLSDDGTIVAVGAYGHAASTGCVRVYQYSGGTWSQLGVDIDGEATGDSSGKSVALSADGTIVAIGARYNDGNGADAGHVRVYEYSGGAWSQLGSDIDGEASDDDSGSSVALSADGTIVAIGAPYNDGNGPDAGHVRVYEYSGGAWSQLGSDIDGEWQGNNSGWSVALSSDGTKLAVGAPNNNGNGTESGHVRVYEYSSGAWSQLGSDIDGDWQGNNSGRSVALSSDGTRLAVGAPNNNGNGSDSGHARVYQYSSGTWSKLGSDIDGEAASDRSGSSVSLSSDGTILAIGATGNDGNGTSAGHTRLYQYSSGAWSQLGADIDGEAEYDNSGESVSLSADGTRLAVGASANDGTMLGNALVGHVRAYSISTAAALNITYDSQGGSTVTDGDTTTTTGGSITTLPTDPTRDGYTFTGWYTAASGGTQLTAGAAHGQTADFALYAQWTANPTTTTTAAPTTTTTVPTTTTPPAAPPPTTTTTTTTTTVPTTTTAPTTTVPTAETQGADPESGVGLEGDPAFLPASPALQLPRTGRDYDAIAWSMLLAAFGTLITLATRRRTPSPEGPT